MVMVTQRDGGAIAAYGHGDPYDRHPTTGTRLSIFDTRFTGCSAGVGHCAPASRPHRAM
jgi:hypothetical protein